MRHESVNMHRLSQNPKEAAILKLWQQQNENGDTLSYILGKDNRRASLTVRDEEVAASVIQWLGSPVGQAFLRDIGGQP